MTAGWLAAAVREALADGVALATAITDDLLKMLAGGPALTSRARLTNLLETGHVPGQKPVAQAVDADTLHHGCWSLHVCAVNNTVSVVPLSGFACPICDSSPADSPAGDRPAAVSDGIPTTTAPAAGHPNPLRDAAAADARISKRLNSFIARHRR